MNRFFVIIAAVLMLQACGGTQETPDPQRDALAAAIAGKVGADAQVTFTAFTKADSTTFGQEFDHRCKVFDMKLEQDTKLYEEYRGKHMDVNADKKRKAIASDKHIIAGLEGIAASIEGSRDDVAYYDYVFSGHAKTASGDVVFENYWASITPDGKVLCFQPEQKGLHKALGRVLPGYEALVKGEE